MFELQPIGNPFYLLASAVCLAVPLLLSLRQHAFGTSDPRAKIPERRKDGWPVVGSLKFWTARWDFFNEYRNLPGESRNFTFHTGPYPVVGLIGQEARRVFFEDKRLSLDDGYAMLFGMTPALKPQSEESVVFDAGTDENMTTAAGFGRYFQKRLIEMLRPKNFAAGLPGLLSDTVEGIDAIADEPLGMTSPFDSVYGIVFRLTVRMLACQEIADDSKLLGEMLDGFESIAKSSTPASVINPWWLLTPGRVGRFWGGYKLYTLITRTIIQRQKDGRRFEDATQVLLDHGDSPKLIARWIINAIFAGYANTAVNAAYVLCYLAANPHWRDRVRKEVEQVAEQQYQKGENKSSVLQALQRVSIGEWCSAFTALDLCIRETIRMTVMGAAFRWNATTSDISLGGSSGEVIPPGAYAAYHVGDVHTDPDIYPQPDTWDPARYLPSRAEHAKVSHGYLGWGSGRHACLGMQFAKLEQTMVAAFFVARFDFALCDGHGNVVDQVPLANRNTIVNEKPKDLYLKISERDVMSST